MADMIDIHNDGSASFYALREPGWHRLGYVSQEAMPIAEAVRLANMDHDWSTHPVQTTVMDMDGVTTLDIPDKFAVVRTNKRLNERRAFGPVGTRYTPHPIEEVFSFVDELQGGGATIETLGSLGRGEREFVTIKLPHTATIGGKDASNLYLFAGTSFDGTTATSFDATAVRVVCGNTWKMAKRASQAVVKFRHTADLDVSNVEKARMVLELSLGYAEDLTMLGNRLLGTALRDEDAANVLAALFPFPEHVKPGMSWDSLDIKSQNAVTKAQGQRQAVFGLYKNSPAKATPDTGWGLYNAVTEYADWFSPLRNDDDGMRRAEKILLGEFDDVKDRALDLLLV